MNSFVVPQIPKSKQVCAINLPFPPNNQHDVVVASRTSIGMCLSFAFMTYFVNK